MGLGCNNFGWRLDSARTKDVVDAAMDAGIDFFDTADLYGDGASEEYLGKALGSRRSQVVIATKFGHERSSFGKGARPEHVRRMLNGSLARLATDYVDLYQIHQPDPDTPIADTLATMGDLVREGKVREIGCSQFSVAQMREAERAMAAGGPKFVSVQNEFSMLTREPEDGVLAECARQGMAFLPFFPLASGMLTGKYRQGKPNPEKGRLSEGKYEGLLSERNYDLVERLVAFAEPRGHTMIELAISWLLSHREVASVIAGATKPEQVRMNAASGGWALDASEMREVAAVLTG